MCLRVNVKQFYCALQVIFDIDLGFYGIFLLGVKTGSSL